MIDKQPASVGELLANYMKQNLITQKELALDLGIAQPYLSMIMNGHRKAGSLDLQLRICQRLQVSPSTIGISATMLNSNDAELLYEEALVALGSGDLASAEIGFMLVAGETELEAIPRFAVSDSLRHRALLRIANIRRDWSQLDGPEGAVVLYKRCLAQFKKEGSTRYGKETELFLTACQEMSENLDGALKSYRAIAENETDRTALRGRARNRAGVIYTKKGQYDEARIDLNDALSIAVNLESQTTYAYVLEKLAILEAHEGNFDQARRNAARAEAMILPGERLRAVQNSILFSDISYREGDLQTAESVLETALMESDKCGFEHQVNWIRRFQARMERNS